MNMPVTAQLSGIHPRSELLIELTRSYDRGKAERADVDDQVKRDTVDLIRLQEESGFETVSDGSLTWQDQLRPIVESLNGVTTGTRYDRWFDTNTFYKKPTIEQKISVTSFNPKNFVQTDLLPTTKGWKVTLPGPYTFSQLAENLHYQDQQSLLDDIAHSENEIIRRLKVAGVSQFQISEPCLVYRPYREDEPRQDELDQALATIRKAIEGIDAAFTVQTYFGDAASILSGLVKLPVETVGFDLFETDSSQLKIDTDKKVALGIVDSRESNVEDSKWIAETATRTSKNLSSGEIILVPNSDLKFVPRRVADAKARALAQATKLVQETA